jgi:hypothetical protein
MSSVSNYLFAKLMSVWALCVMQRNRPNEQNSRLGHQTYYPEEDSGTAVTGEDCYYTARAQPPLKADGNSIIARGEQVRIRFTLFADGVPTCDLPLAKLSLSLLNDPTVVLVRANFDIGGSEYAYNLSTEFLTPGTPYQIMILVHGTEAGSALFSVQ